nr:Chain C, Nonamer peptide: LEU-THR-VAL-GLN-VAL-ALA-ARG-VAL-TRP [synthetic construct]5VWD_C Chain C, Noamer peptide: LEU-THR-VAL-GLN-VAL-ALA-ARG-VAL-TRP [synthetic construct]5VWJ_C Chain C, Nonamer peptide: LEU-THR-VAL-GLN-VAL-ALA-ARG-VAL-TRP [synthetic construct]
LTVQVARVW